jgi:hypothetical protein
MNNNDNNKKNPEENNLRKDQAFAANENPRANENLKTDTEEDEDSEQNVSTSLPGSEITDGEGG